MNSERCNQCKHFIIANAGEGKIYGCARSKCVFEPTTKNDLAIIHTEGLDEEIRCTMCTNSMKSNRGCDGSCVVNKDMYKAVMDTIEERIQPTTKNNLGVDCISRADVNRLICEYRDDAAETGSERDLERAYGANAVGELISDLPSVTPQEPRWIPVSERLPEAEYGESDSMLVCFENGTQDVLYFDGSNWRYPTGESYVSVNHKNGWHNKVIAWMPLPQAYREVEE